MSGYALSIAGTKCLTDRKKAMVCLLTILLINWIANFWNIADLGLYVDDYSRIPQTMEIVESESSRRDLLADIISSPVHIRPLHGDLIKFFTFLGTTIGGLSAIYLIGYLISSINAILFFLLLWRIIPNLFFALAGALAICLYPVASSKIWLTSLLGIQPGLTLLLTALLCYMGNHKRRSYLLMAVSLFCYESYYPVFFAAPLLRQGWNRSLWKELHRHLWVSAAVFASYFSMKVVFSDPRVAQIDHLTVLESSIHNLIAGPWINFKRHLSLPVRNLMDLPAHLLLLQVGSFIFLWLVFCKIHCRMQPNYVTCAAGHSPEADHKVTTGRSDARFDSRRWIRSVVIQKIPEIAKYMKPPIITGILILGLAYTMTFYGSVFHCYGISSRIHSAAAPGMAMLIAAMAVGLLHLCWEKKKKHVAMALLALFFSSCLTYNFRIQKAYVASRDIQRSFWTQVVNLCPDLVDGSVILVEPSGLGRVNAIESTTWATNLILERIYQFPRHWRFVPRLYLITDPEIRYATAIGKLAADHSLARLEQMGIITEIWPDDRHRPPDPAKTIVLTSEGGILYRSFDPEKLHQKVAVKKNSIEPQERFHRGILYEHLIEEQIDINERQRVRFWNEKGKSATCPMAGLSKAYGGQ